MKKQNQIIFIPYFIKDENIYLGMQLFKLSDTELTKNYIKLNFNDLDFTGEETIKEFFKNNIEFKYYNNNFSKENLYLENILNLENENVFVYFYELDENLILEPEDAFNKIIIRFVSLNEFNLQKDVIYFSVFNTFLIKSLK